MERALLWLVGLFSGSAGYDPRGRGLVCTPVLPFQLIRRDSTLEERVSMNGQDRERLELEKAGWKRLEREGETVWRTPENGFVYPQGVAIAMVREGVNPDVPKEPEGGA